MSHENGNRPSATPITTGERSGVLHPQNLRRYGARWFDADPSIAAVVERFWQVDWALDPGEVIGQHIITAPAVTLSIEEGGVPAPLVITGVHGTAWWREIAGTGSVLGIRLRPAGLASVSDLLPLQIADATIPVTPGLDSGLFELMSRAAKESTPEARIRAVTDAVRARLAARPLSQELLLANAVVDELGARLRTRSGRGLAQQFRVSERVIQRALKSTLGHGPKWVSRWIRLQEVARALSANAEPDVAALAVDLGYTDQAHLLNDFRRATGITPGRYVRSLMSNPVP